MVHHGFLSDLSRFQHISRSGRFCRLSFVMFVLFWPNFAPRAPVIQGGSLLERIVPSRSVSVDLGRQNAVSVVSVVSVVSDSPTVSFRGRFLLEVLGACHGKKSLYAAISKSKVGSLRAQNSNLGSFHDASWCIWRSQLRKPSALRDQDALSRCQNLRPDSRVLLRVLICFCHCFNAF